MPLTRKLATEFIGCSGQRLCWAAAAARWCTDLSPRDGPAVLGIQAAPEPSSPGPDRQFAPRLRFPPR